MLYLKKSKMFPESSPNGQIHPNLITSKNENVLENFVKEKPKWQKFVKFGHTVKDQLEYLLPT